MKVLELLQSFNCEQEKQNKVIHSKFKDEREKISQLHHQIEDKISLLKAYASYDEITEKMAKLQHSMHSSHSMFDSLSHQLSKLSV